MPSTSGELVHLEVAAEEREALALCLGLGTFRAMREGLLPLEAGVWTLGRPAFWGPLGRAGMPAEVLEVFRGSDELAALERLAGRTAAESRLEEMIGVVGLPHRWRAPG